MFYLNFVKDKYKVLYICGTPKGKNQPQTTLPKTHPPNTQQYYWTIIFLLRLIPWSGPVPLCGLHTPRSVPAFTYNLFNLHFLNNVKFQSHTYHTTLIVCFDINPLTITHFFPLLLISNESEYAYCTTSSNVWSMSVKLLE